MAAEATAAAAAVSSVDAAAIGRPLVPSDEASSPASAPAPGAVVGAALSDLASADGLRTSA